MFTLGVSLVTGLMFGLAPAVQTSRTNLQETLKEGGRSSSSDRSGHALRRVLVVAEVALALTLLTGAGLLIKSLALLQEVNPGFDASGLLTFNVAIPNAQVSIGYGAHSVLRSCDRSGACRAGRDRRRHHIDDCRSAADGPREASRSRAISRRRTSRARGVTSAS